MNQDIGKVIITIGIVILAVGVIIYFFWNKFGWIGNLPGDIRIEKGNTRIYFPITTLLIASILISLILRFFK